MDTRIPLPAQGRTFGSRCRVRLSDMDAGGRLRLDAVARYLQDVAGDDVDETGWGAPEHLWVIRRVLLDVDVPFLRDREVEVVTWCSGLGAVAAGRRWSLRGDAGGRAEVDSVWIHLGPDGAPARLVDFGVYAEATAGRHVSTRFELAEPATTSDGLPWPLRPTDIDLLDHVNNAVYWQAVEHCLPGSGLDPRRPLRAQLEYRQPLDLGDDVALVVGHDGSGLDVGFAVAGAVKAVARVEQSA
jgi:acyl-ACP thioesterase